MKSMIVTLVMVLGLAACGTSVESVAEAASDDPVLETVAEPASNLGDTATLTTLDVDQTAAELLEECVICEAPSGYDGPLTAGEVEGLLLALNDEYHALAVYDRVMADHGVVKPFSNIANAEQNHIERLIGLFEAYDLSVPENPWMGQTDSLGSVTEACQVGVDAEIINVTLYSYLFSTTDRDDITLVYERLQAASNDRHLPAFERCGAGGAGGGRGGNGHGNGFGNGSNQDA